jgi:hypothetical protein
MTAPRTLPGDVATVRVSAWGEMASEGEWGFESAPGGILMAMRAFAALLLSLIGFACQPAQAPCNAVDVCASRDVD